jgi:drug/metabolite transporter (DMT)-like permease
VPSGDDDRRRRLVVAVLITTGAAILGFNLVALKVAIEHSNPVTTQALSMGLAVAAMFVVAELTGEPRRLERRWWPAAASMSATLAVGSTLGVAFGVERVQAGVAALLISTTPIFTLLLGNLLLRQRHSWHGAVGVMVGFLGVAVVAFAEQQEGGSTQLLGVIYLVLGALGWSLGLIMMQMLAADAPRSTLLAWTFLFGVPILVLVAVVTSGFSAEWSLVFVVALIYSGAVAKGVSFLLQLTVVRLATPVQASLTALLMPVFGTLAGVLLLDETIRGFQIVAALPVLGGVGLVLRSSVIVSGR